MKFNGLLKRGSKRPPIEASTRFELVHDGFADRSLTAWVRRLKIHPVLRQFNKLKVYDMDAVLSERSDSNRRP